MNPRLTEDWQRLCDRWQANGYAALSDVERVWFNVRALVDSVENGGLISYFYNSGADTYEDCVAALKHLRAFDIVQQVTRLGSLFGHSVPSSVEERNAIINGWPDDGPQADTTEEADDLLMPLMEVLERRLDEYLLHQGVGR